MRIYRREGSPGKLVGMVEEIGVKGRRAFKDINELWDILSEKKMREPLKDKRRGRYS